MTSKKQNALRREGARNTYRGSDYRAVWQAKQVAIAASSDQILKAARARLARDPAGGLRGFSRKAEAIMRRRS